MSNRRRGPLAGVDTRRLAPFWSFLLGTGARRGEALALRWSDVDLEAGAVTLRRSMAMAKDAQGRWTPTYTSPKAGASRTVDLDADLVDTLRWHRKAQEDERDERPGAYEDHGLVFAREDGSHLRPEYVSKLLPRLARTAGVPVIRLHDLRHTHAAILLSAGVPLFVVSKRLGHKTQAMTSDLYGHLVPGANRAAAETWADQPRQARQTSEP